MQNFLFPASEQQININHLKRVEAPGDYRVPVLFPRIRDAKRISLDFETYDKDLLTKGPGVYRDAHIVGAGIAIDDGPGTPVQFADYYPMRHIVGENCDADKVTQWLRDELNDFCGEIVGANVNLYDGDFAQHVGIRPKNAKWRDIQWAEALLDEHAIDYSLERTATKYLGTGKVTAQLRNIYGEDYIKYFRETHPAYAKNYVMGDITLPFPVLDAQTVQLKKEGLWKLFELESRLTPMLLYFREHGVRVDVKQAEILRERLIQEEKETAKQMRSVLGFDIDIYSSDDIGKAFDKLGLPYLRTELGNPSFTKPWLVLQEHPIAKLIMNARQLDKFKTTFIEGSILNGNIDGRIHGQFHPLRWVESEGETSGTISGRFSSSNPNLQNIPIRSPLGKEMRALFIPEDGMLWGGADYSQIEYRFMVHFAVKTGCALADVPQRMYIEKPDTDFHAMVAELTGKSRDEAKTLNFGMLYGMGVAKLARSLGLLNPDGTPSVAALEVMEQYHEKAPFIRELYNKASDKAQKNGFVKTILGRRSRFELWEPKYTEKGKYYEPFPFEQAKQVYGDKLKRSKTHKALNCVLQGSAADLMKLSMVKIYESGIIESEGIIPHLTVHDELDNSVLPGERGIKAMRAMQDIMENCMKLEVPVLTSGKIGINWREAH